MKINLTQKEFFKGPLLRYFRELSIVILGVAVTFAGSSLFNSRSTDKQLKYYFNAIKMEMEANLQQIDTLSLFLEYSRDFANYLSRTPVNQLNPDSISKWEWDNAHNWSVFETSMIVTYMNDAFETFKSSGMMSYSKTPELLLQIQKCNTDLRNMENTTNSYMKDKVDKKLYAMDINSGSTIEILSNPSNKPLLSLMGSVGFNESCWKNAKEVAKELKACIAAIEKSCYADKNNRK